jgi:hypothetical protein
MSKQVIIFDPSRYEEEGDDAFLLLDGDEKVPSYHRLSTDVVRANLRNFIDSLGEILPELRAGLGEFGLQELQVAVGINGKGQVGFLGTGAEVGARRRSHLTLSEAR